MAAFVAKQMVGNKLNAVKGAVGGDDGDGDDKEKEEEAERERQEAIREAEERRKEKHRKMEEEREKMRQEIRDKYNIKKKEEVQEAPPPEPDNPLMRKKKTPEELAREAEAEDQDDFTKLKNSIETQVNELKTQIESKCSLQWTRTQEAPCKPEPANNRRNRGYRRLSPATRLSLLLGITDF